MTLPQMHGRTHCPDGSDPIPPSCLSGWTGDSALMTDLAISGTGTVSDNVLTDIHMEEISIATGSTAFTTNSSLPTEKPIKCILNGWYIFYLNFEWSGSPYTDQRTYSLFITNLADNSGDQNVVQSASAPFINAAYNGTFGPLYIRGADLSGSWFKVRVQQNSGTGPQTITSVTLTAMFLGPDLDPARMPPF